MAIVKSHIPIIIILIMENLRYVIIILIISRHMISFRYTHVISYVFLLLLSYIRYGSVDTTNHNTILTLAKKPLSSTLDSGLFVSRMTNPPSTVNLDHERNYQPRDINSVRITVYMCMCIFLSSKKPYYENQLFEENAFKI